MTGRRLAIAVVAVFAAMVLLTAAPGVAGADGDAPNVTVYMPDGELEPGTEQPVEVQIQNNASAVDGDGTITNVTIAGTDGPLAVKTGTTALGSIPDGQVVTVTLTVVVPEDLGAGTYPIEGEVSYAYRDGGSIESETAEFSVTATVPDAPRFAVSTNVSAPAPGDSGTVPVEIENVGTATAYDLRTILSGQGGLTIGDGVATDAVGDLAPGETTEVLVDVAIAETAGTGEKPIDAEFSFADANGVDRSAGPIRGSMQPAQSPELSIVNVEDTLAVGYDGEITGELTNEGPGTVDDAVLIVEVMSDSLFVEDTRYALPSLAAGESAAFRYPTDVSGDADEGPRQVRFTVEYSGADGQILSSQPMSDRVYVDPRTDEFSLEGISTEVTAGETDELRIELTNERPETLRNIDAMLFADSPLSVVADSAFVPELDPGESTEISFEIAAAGDARATTYPVELDFEYTTERGQTELSDVYQFPVDVLENDEADDGLLSGPLVAVGALAAVVALGGAALWWRRR